MWAATPLLGPTRPWLLPHGWDDKRNMQRDGLQAVAAQHESRSVEAQARGPCGPQGAWMPPWWVGGGPEGEPISGRQRAASTQYLRALNGLCSVSRPMPLRTSTD